MGSHALQALLNIFTSPMNLKIAEDEIYTDRVKKEAAEIVLNRIVRRRKM